MDAAATSVQSADWAFCQDSSLLRQVLQVTGCAHNMTQILHENCPKSLLLQQRSSSSSMSLLMETTSTTLSETTNLAQQNAAMATTTTTTTMETDLYSQTQLQQPLTKFAYDYLMAPMRQIEDTLDYIVVNVWHGTGDERTNRFPFMSGGPWKLLYATMLYLYLIKMLLPKFMEKRKPFELNWIIRIYNLLMVVCNLWSFYHATRILNYGLKCFGCQTIDHLDYAPATIELLHYGWLFMLSRLVEWLDTIFFVLRKKDRQVTKLHVFHHSFVPSLAWIYLKYHPGFTMAFFPLINSFVHSIMYSYYFLATFGPKLQPYLWWKRYLTSLQIAQFVLILIQLASIPMTGNDKCQYPRGFLYAAFGGAMLFLWLFYTYYVDTYIKSGKTTDNKNSLRQHLQDSKSASLEKKSKSDLVCSKTQNRQHHQQQQLSQRRIETKDLVKNTRLMVKEREGTSRALSEAIENAIDSFCDLGEPSLATRTKSKIV